MGWTTMQFAAGMAAGGAVAATAAWRRGRGWRCVPLAMTLGGLGAILLLPLAPPAPAWAQSWGDALRLTGLFRGLTPDAGRLGLGLILLQYNLAIAPLLLADPTRREGRGRAWVTPWRRRGTVGVLRPRHEIAFPPARLRSSHLSRAAG